MSAPPSVRAGAEDTGAAARARAWLDAALMLWCAHGQADNGAFYEALDWSLKPMPQPWVRFRVQARQVHVCARAALTKRHAAAADHAERGFAFMLRSRKDKDDAYAARLMLDGGGDGAPQLYDQAFALLACASMAALGDGRALKEAERLSAVLARDFGQPRGFSDRRGPVRRYRQNPHMHLLEACLALYQVSGDARFLARADEMVALFHDTFYAPPRPSSPPRLREYFDSAWRPLRTYPLEPGHYFEWVWLLHGWARAHKKPVPPAAAELFRWAWAHGRGAHGVALHGVAEEGERALPPPWARLWQQTEMLRACLCEAPQEVAGVFAMLETHWLDTKPLGLWRDAQAHAEDAARPPFVPASTLYHLWGALAALAGDEV